MLMFTNSAGLDILETTLINIQDMSLETVLGDECQKALFLELPKIMNQVMLTIINLPLLHLQHTFTGAMTKILELKHGRFASPLLSSPLVPTGVCQPPWRGVQVKHGTASFVRAGGGVEGGGRRWHAALPHPHAGQLDLRLKAGQPRCWLLCSCRSSSPSFILS
jgi:hypothetical protein